MLRRSRAGLALSTAIIVGMDHIISLHRDELTLHCRFRDIAQCVLTRCSQHAAIRVGFGACAVSCLFLAAAGCFQAVAYPAGRWQMMHGCHAGGEEQVQLEVTDGWYSVSASIDGPLRHYLAAGVLRTGQPCSSGALLADRQAHATPGG